MTGTQIKHRDDVRPYKSTFLLLLFFIILSTLLSAYCTLLVNCLLCIAYMSLFPIPHHATSVTFVRLILCVWPQWTVGLIKFSVSVSTMCVCRGPGVEGVAPAEASERLQISQAKFDQLWRKYITCSGGEELFGLPVKGVTD